MHFRDRGASIQLVRTVYDAATKKPKTAVVGSIARPALAIDEALSGLLTAQELGELKAHITKLRNAEALEREYQALTFLSTMDRVGAWLDGVDKITLHEFAAEVRRPLNRLHRRVAELEKAG